MSSVIQVPPERFRYFPGTKFRSIRIRLSRIGKELLDNSQTVLRDKRVTVDIIKGEICVYFLVGIIRACFYLLVLLFDPQAFSIEKSPLFYLSFTTLATVGYGDIVPVNPFAQTLSKMESIAGQIYLTVFAARLAGLYIVQEMPTNISIFGRCSKKIFIIHLVNPAIS